MEEKQERRWCVYKHTNKINGKVYIGQTGNIPQRRWQSKGNGYRGNPAFWRAIQKYGWDNFEHEIVFDNLTLEEANQLEIKLIAEYNSTDSNCGYNLTYGGKNGKHSEETKKKISEAQRGEKGNNWGKRGELSARYGIKHTEEARRKMRENSPRLSGKDNGFYGKRHTEETKRKMRENHYDCFGENNSFYGKHHSLETKRKLGKPVKCIELNQTFFTITEAQEVTGVDRSLIVKCCKGKRKTAGDYHWEYV